MSSTRLPVRLLAAVALATGVAVVPADATANAQPPGFPDLTAFTDAPTNLHFSRPDRWASGHAFFRTPDGLSCMMGSLTQCSGALPGLPAGVGAECAEVLQTADEATRSEPFRFETPTDGCPTSTEDLLDVGQKLTFTTNYLATCVVGEGRLTACIQNGHGFVLQPSGSWVF
jgi:hypothetical protein